MKKYYTSATVCHCTAIVLISTVIHLHSIDWGSFYLTHTFEMLAYISFAAAAVICSKQFEAYLTLRNRLPITLCYGLIASFNTFVFNNIVYLADATANALPVPFGVLLFEDLKYGFGLKYIAYFVSIVIAAHIRELSLKFVRYIKRISFNKRTPLQMFPLYSVGKFVLRDISDSDFFTIKKIRTKGTFVLNDTLFNIIEDMSSDEFAEYHTTMSGGEGEADIMRGYLVYEPQKIKKPIGYIYHLKLSTNHNTSLLFEKKYIKSLHYKDVVALLDFICNQASKNETCVSIDTLVQGGNELAFQAVKYAGFGHNGIVEGDRHVYRKRIRDDGYDD